jgi:(S)-sulfolactate dehydrogenase
MRVVITEFMDEAAVARLAAVHETFYDPQLAERLSELAPYLADADALIVRNRTRVDARLLATAVRLKVIGRLGVGLDNIDMAAARARGIAVIPATGANALAVAEYVIATALLLLRGAYLSSAAVANGEWPRAALSAGREIAGKTLGVVGFGTIGRLTAKLGRGLSMRVVGHDPDHPATSAVWREAQASPLPLEALLGEADVVTLHVPLTAVTRGMIDAAKLACMKANAVLINTARGGIVDEVALADALRNGRLGGAALDVFEDEPLPAGSPLAGCPSLILTPHIAGVTRESNARVSAMIAEQVAAFLARNRGEDVDADVRAG